MDFTETLNWLSNVDWIREAIGTTAIACGMVGKWKLGSGKRVGWIWGFIGSFFWLWFAIRIESPTGVINNFVFLLLSIRGYKAWERFMENKENGSTQGA